MRSRFLRGLTVLAGVLSLAGPAKAQVTNFSTDVATAIDKSLDYIAATNGFGGGYGDATGLAVLAALEKRADADQNSVSAGYAGANAVNQARIDSGIAYLVANQNASFYSYRNGQELMALAIYLRTGGPNPGAMAAFNKAFDEASAHVPADVNTWGGFFNYSNATGTDASTNQFMMSGLAAARSIYGPSGFAPDAVRFARLEAITARSAAVYLTVSGSDGLSGTERGIAYNTGQQRSLQQTASGAWILQVGGLTLNHSGVQGFLEWLRNRYAYTTNAGAAANWGTMSYGYYLWSAAKAFTFLEDSGVVPCTGVAVPDVSCTGVSLTTDDIGILPAASAPAFAAREVHRDPTTVARPALFGAGGAGFYNDANEPARWYFDFAYTIISRQNANGSFQYLGPWSGPAEQSYYTLVLTRSVGGGCLDTDEDGVCDADDNCPSAANDNQADGDADGQGDACDACPNDADNDADADGVCGDVDNCAADANANQADADADGQGDACDACPNDAENDADADGVCGDVDNCAVANPDQADLDGDGLGDACDACPNDASNDADGDGFCGAVDNCPNVANANQVDSDLDGLGDACDACALDAANDADGDGVCGNVDNCATANPDQLDSDRDGVGDACDACALDASNDADADGVCGNVDNCPAAANANQADTDGDGIGDVCDTINPPSCDDGSSDDHNPKHKHVHGKGHSSHGKGKGKGHDGKSCDDGSSDDKSSDDKSGKSRDKSDDKSGKAGKKDHSSGKKPAVAPKPAPKKK